MKPAYAIEGTQGHPLHPPLTDVVIGAYAVATLGVVLGALGVSEAEMASVWWIALLVGLGATVPAALTGFWDWLKITVGTPLWRTATLHLAVMVSAAVLLGLAALFGHDRYVSGELGGGTLVLTLVGFGLLTIGGWLGGSIVFVHGMRVLGRLDEPTASAIAPVPHGQRPREREPSPRR